MPPNITLLLSLYMDLSLLKLIAQAVMDVMHEADNT